MKQFTSHLDYLIQCNNCVIVPEFGGFILNKEDAFIALDGYIFPPSVVIGFNPDLRHNDGLLAESFMHTYAISYEASCKKIKEIVDNLKAELKLKKTVRLGHLGKVSLLENGELNFIPDTNLSFYYPDTYGLHRLSIRPLEDISSIKNVTKTHKQTAKKTKLYRFGTAIAGAAAAVLVFFVTTTPIVSDEANNNVTQKSGFLVDVINTPKAVADIKNLSSKDKDQINQATVTTSTKDSNYAKNSEKKTEENISNIAVTKAEKVEKPTEKLTKQEVAKTNTVAAKNSKEKPVVPTVKNTAKYYIIAGSVASQVEVDRLKKQLTRDGIKEHNVLKYGKNRYRVYVASFENKDKAQQYLNTFRKTKSRYNDAWLYINNAS